MNKKILILIVIVFMILSCKNKSRFSFYSLDKNKNSFIEKDEFLDNKVSFNTIDIDKDNKISFQELYDYMNLELKNKRIKEEPYKLIKLWDKNKNNTVDFNEFPYSRDLFILIAGKKDKEFNADQLAKNLSSFYKKYHSLIKEENALFLIFDKNNDGNITENEFSKKNDEYFYKYFDLNQDGNVSKNEVSERKLSPHKWTSLMGVKKVSESFAQLDINKNGLLDKNELNNFRYLIELIDLDSDGLLNMKEILSAKEFLKKGPSAFKKYTLTNEFNKYDKNKDQSLTKDEVDGRLLYIIDKDKNGKVNISEFLNSEKEIKENLFKKIKPNIPNYGDFQKKIIY